MLPKTALVAPAAPPPRQSAIVIGSKGIAGLTASGAAGLASPTNKGPTATAAPAPLLKQSSTPNRPSEFKAAAPSTFVPLFPPVPTPSTAMSRHVTPLHNELTFSALCTLPHLPHACRLHLCAGAKFDAKFAPSKAPAGRLDVKSNVSTGKGASNAIGGGAGATVLQNALRNLKSASAGKEDAAAAVQALGKMASNSRAVKKMSQNRDTIRTLIESMRTRPKFGKMVEYSLECLKNLAVDEVAIEELIDEGVLEVCICMYTPLCKSPVRARASRLTFCCCRYPPRALASNWTGDRDGP
jgi:hypothetical protein